MINVFNFKCKTCQKIFRDKPSAKRQYCSMPCYRKSRIGKSYKPRNEIICKECGKLFPARPWSVKYRGKKYCSKKCYSKNQQSPMLGKKHTKKTRLKLSLAHVGKVGELASNWKGGIWRIGKKSDNDRLERMRFRETIQLQVFQRDNYTCQMCGQRGGDLQVDHIQSWKDYVDLRFDINNCRTLCSRCHYKLTFGKDMPQGMRVWGYNLKHIIEGMVD